jgi:hypothetical protein
MQCSPDVKIPSSTANRGRNTAASTPSGVGGGREKREKGKTKTKKRLDDTYIRDVLYGRRRTQHR